MAGQGCTVNGANYYSSTVTFTSAADGENSHEIGRQSSTMYTYQLNGARLSYYAGSAGQTKTVGPGEDYGYFAAEITAQGMYLRKYTQTGTIGSFTYYTITTKTGLTGGNVYIGASGSSTSANVVANSRFTIRAVPASGYVVTNVNGVNIDPPSENAESQEYTAMADLADVSATFAKYYNIRFYQNKTSSDKANKLQSPILYGDICNLKTLNELAWTRPGYKFLGWNTKRDGTGTSYTDGQAISNLTSTAGGTVFLYAQWAQYTITYAPNGGSSTPAAQTGYGDVTLAAAISRNGYDFSGWKIGSTTYAAGATYALVANVTATAQWSAYTVSYDTHGGSACASGSGTVTLPTTTRTGYTFNGWYTAASGGTKVGNAGASYAPTANTTLHAQWSVKMAELMFDNLFSLWGWIQSSSHALRNSSSGATLSGNDWPTIYSGSGTNVYTQYGKSAEYFNIPVSGGGAYKFSCLVSGTSQSAQMYFVQLTSSYQIIKNGTNDYTQVAPAVAIKEGSYVQHYGTHTLAANCAFVQLFFDVHDTGKTAKFSSVRVCKAEPYGLVSLSKTRQNFSYTDDATKKFSEVISANPVFATATRTGHTFQGWYTADGGSSSGGTGTLVTADSLVKDFPESTPLYSQWTGISYSVAFNKNAADATGTMANESFTYGTAKALTSNAFSRTGYTFSGWATSSGGAVVYSNGQSVSNLTTTAGATVTLYAKWTAKKYDLTVDPNGGTFQSSTSPTVISNGLAYDSYSYRAITPAKRDYYFFMGWYTSASGGTQLYTSVGRNLAVAGYWSAAWDSDTSKTGVYKRDGALTVYAQWNPYQATINFTMNGGSFPSGTQISGNKLTTYYGTAANVPNPTRANYTFAGWTVNGVSSGAKRGNSSGSVATDLADGATGVMQTWFMNLSTTNNAQVTFTAQWTRITKTVTMSNPYYRMSIVVDEQDGAGASWARSAEIDARSSSTSPSAAFTVKVGARYRVMAIFTAETYYTSNFYLPGSLVVGDYVEAFAFSRVNGFSIARFTAIKQVEAGDTSSMQWTITTRSVQFTNVLPTPNPHIGGIAATFRFDDSATTNVRMTAKDDMTELVFSQWTDISPSDALQPSGGSSSSSQAIVLATSSNVTLKANYALRPQSVSASVHSATSAAIQGLSANVYAGSDTSGTAISNIGYGQTATWVLSGTIPTGYAFDGWYNGDAKVSTSTTYTTTVTSALSLVAKCKAAVTFRSETYDAAGAAQTPPVNNVRGSIAVNGATVASGYSAQFTLGSSVTISATTPQDDYSHFSSWFEGAQRTGSPRLGGYAATANHVVTKATDLLAYFTDSASVFYVALYGRENGVYGSYGTLAIATEAGEVEALSASDYASESGYAAVTSTGAAFYRVTGIRRVDASVTGNTYDVTRVLRGTPGDGVVGSPVQIASGMPFGAVIDESCSFIVDFGNLSTRRLIVARVTGSTGGTVSTRDAVTVQERRNNGAYERSVYEIGRDYVAVATPGNGYVFAGWFDNAAGTGSPVSTESTYRTEMTAASGNPDVIIYAKFELGSFALYRWEGADTRKQLTWRSKVYELSKPANLTSVRVDAATLGSGQDAYPLVRFRYGSWSSPDKAARAASGTSPGGEVDFGQPQVMIEDQRMRRLPARRPERYFQVEVTATAEVDAIIIGTSGEGLAT